LGYGYLREENNKKRSDEKERGRKGGG